MLCHALLRIATVLASQMCWAACHSPVASLTPLLAAVMCVLMISSESATQKFCTDGHSALAFLLPLMTPVASVLLISSQATSAWLLEIASVTATSTKRNFFDQRLQNHTPPIVATLANHCRSCSSQSCGVLKFWAAVRRGSCLY